MGACAGRYFVRKACLPLPKHRNLVGCKVVSSYVSGTIPQLILIYTRQVFNRETDKDRDGQVCTFDNECVKEVKEINVQKCLGVWEVPEEYFLTQSFSSYILYDLSTIFDKEELFEMARNIPANQHIGNWRAGLNIYDVSSLLAFDCRDADNFMSKSAIQHKDTRRG